MPQRSPRKEGYRVSLAFCFVARRSRTRRLLGAPHSPGKHALAGLGVARLTGANPGAEERSPRRALHGSRRPGGPDGKCGADADRRTNPRTDADRSSERRPEHAAPEPERAAEADDGPEAEADRHACPADTLV